MSQLTNDAHRSDLSLQANRRGSLSLALVGLVVLGALVARAAGIGSATVAVKRPTQARIESVRVAADSASAAVQVRCPSASSGCAVALSGAAAGETFSKRSKAGASIYFGALVGGKAPATSAFAKGGAYARFEQQVQKRMALIQWGQPWKFAGRFQPFQRRFFDNVRAHGSIPVINWGSWELGRGARQPAFELRDLYEGSYDAYVTRWAKAAKAWGHPFMLRFDHEMNGWWYPWGEGKTQQGPTVNGNRPGDYVRAWRHVHDIFTRVGATNVTWLWTPNIVGHNGRYPSLASLYPGGSYVDWTGFSAFSYDRSQYASPHQLLTGAGVDWLDNTYQLVSSLAPRKPMVLAEVGATELGDGGTGKAAWIRDLLTRQLPRNLPRIKAVLWFDWNSTWPDIEIDSSAAAQAAFAQGIGSAVYASNRFRNLSSEPIAPPDSETPMTTWLQLRPGMTKKVRLRIPPAVAEALERHGGTVAITLVSAGSRQPSTSSVTVR